jgi:molybdopterin-guanine dinucleotide biosynthesis protein A
VSFPLAVLDGVCDRVAVVCKAETGLPDIGRAERWNEPEEPRHPLTGMIHAIERAGDAVLVCAADMPYLTAAACRELIAASRPTARDARAVATVASANGALEPLLGVYTAQALPALRAAPAGAPLRATIESLEPRRLSLSPDLLRSVNTPEDLEAAELLLCAGRVGEVGVRPRP